MAIRYCTECGREDQHEDWCEYAGYGDDKVCDKCLFHNPRTHVQGVNYEFDLCPDCFTFFSDNYETFMSEWRATTKSP